MKGKSVKLVKREGLQSLSMKGLKGQGKGGKNMRNKIALFGILAFIICSVSIGFVVTAVSAEQSWTDANGVTWSDPIRVTDDPNKDAKPSIIEFTRYGLLPQLWISWHSSSPDPDLFYKISSAPEDEASWLGVAATQLTTSGGNYRPASARVEIGSSRQLWVVWGTGGGIYYKYYYYKDYYQPIWKWPCIWDWSGDFPLPNSAGGRDPSIIQTSDGYIYITWSSGGNIHFARSIDGGTSWSYLTQLDHGGNEMYPSMAQTDYPWIGVIWVAFHSDQGGDNEIYYAMYDPPNTFLSFNQLTANSVQDEHPTIIQKQNGDIWIAWDRGGEIYYTFTSDQGVFWAPEVDITNDPAIDQTPWIMQDFEGKVWMTWATNRDGNYEIYAMYGLVLCACEEALYRGNVSSPGEKIDSIRELRDELLRDKYVNLYYEYNPEIRGILIEEPYLLIDAANLLVKYIPAVNYVTGRDGEDLKIEEEDVTEAISFIENLKKEIWERREEIGINRSSNIIEFLKKFEKQVNASEGKTFSQAFRDSIYARWPVNETEYKNSITQPIDVSKIHYKFTAVDEEWAAKWTNEILYVQKETKYSIAVYLNETGYVTRVDFERWGFPITEIPYGLAKQSLASLPPGFAIDP